jgi:hypothetical protein
MAAMASHDFDLDDDDVDRLVRELCAPPPPPRAAPTPAGSGASDGAADRQNSRVSHWSTSQIPMPVGQASTRPWPSSIRLPAWLPKRAPGMPAVRRPRVTMPALSETTRAALMVRVWVTLGVLLSTAMPFWPYPKTYLAGLLLHLFAIEVVGLTGLWSAKLSWDGRLGGAHTIALGVVLWAIVLVAEETLSLVSGGV